MFIIRQNCVFSISRLVVCCLVRCLVLVPTPGPGVCPTLLMDKSFRQAFCKRRQELIVYAFADLWLFPSLERAFKTYFKPFQPLYTCKVVSILSYLCSRLQAQKVVKMSI